MALTLAGTAAGAACVAGPAGLLRGPADAPRPCCRCVPWPGRPALRFGRHTAPLLAGRCRAAPAPAPAAVRVSAKHEPQFSSSKPPEQRALDLEALRASLQGLKQEALEQPARATPASSSGARGGGGAASRAAPAAPAAPAGPPKPPAEQPVRVQASRRGRGGKTVTLVTGLSGPEEVLSKLLTRLKSSLGCGGKVGVDDGPAGGPCLELQGEQVDAIVKGLKEAGYAQAKRSGGGK